ncbi:hypothetical protein D9Q98_002532 [Chlorella vulgaris]|uniref:RING-type E3 ubiquitin transferase n=1 Tax=Chlorella vulgaris TaxID=3077 RepID=A0A9D4YZT1_CHLVU|nr:hypothetical protein D9Q98_002532 [Chlorella vulgaris]
MAAEALLWAGLASIATSGWCWLAGRDDSRLAGQLKEYEQLRSLKDLKKQQVLPRLIAVRGRVSSRHPLAGELSGQRAAIIEITEHQVTEKRAASGTGTQATPSTNGTAAGIPGWTRQSCLLRSETTETNWSLADGSGVELPIERGLPVTRTLLKQAASRLMPSGQKGRDRQAEEEMGERTVGVERSERALVLGSVVTMAGVLECTVDYPAAFQTAPRAGGQMLSLRPIYCSRKPMPEMIREAQLVADIWQFEAGLCGAVGGGLLVWAALEHAKEQR